VISEETYEALTAFKERTKSKDMSDALRLLLEKKGEPAKARRNTKKNQISLVQNLTLHNLTEFLFCPSCKIRFDSEIKACSQTVKILMKCKECKSTHTWIGSETHGEFKGPKDLVPRMLISQQLIFGAVEAGLGYDEFVQFSDALSLPVICETYFKNCRTKFLKTISQEYAKQAPLFQLLVANLNDTNFSLYATFSHKRQADFALATLFSINSLIVAFAAIADRKKENTTSQNLEFIASEKILDQLFESEAFKGKDIGITNDQHLQVSKHLSELQEKRAFRHSHDFWHWFKNFKKILNAEAPSEIPKGEWDLVAGTTEVLMKSAKIQSTGDPVLFHTLCQSLPQSLVYLGDTARSYLFNQYDFIPCYPPHLQKSGRGCSNLWAGRLSWPRPSFYTKI